MFDKFGEFDSVEELNQVAAAKMEARDKKALMALAKENGIDKAELEEYMDGIVKELATPYLAASGKLDVEAEDLDLQGVLFDWKEVIEEMCLDEVGTDNEVLCRAVRRKDKCLRDCMAMILRFAFENKVQVSEKVVKATKITHNGKEEPMRGPVYLGIPNRAELRALIRKYYGVEG